MPPEGYLPQLQVGDLFEIDAPETMGHGHKGKVVKVEYHPCRGYGYDGALEPNGTHFNTNDGNGVYIGHLDMKKTGRAKTLFDY